MGIKEAASATFSVLLLTDKEYALEAERGPLPMDRDHALDLANKVARQNESSARHHLLSAVPLAGVFFDAYRTATVVGDEFNTMRARLGKPLSLAVNAGGWIAAVATGDPWLAVAGSAYHVLLAGVDAAQIPLFRWASEKRLSS